MITPRTRLETPEELAELRLEHRAARYEADQAERDADAARDRGPARGWYALWRYWGTARLLREELGGALRHDHTGAERA